MNKIIKSFILLSASVGLLSLPLLTLAQSAQPSNGMINLVNEVAGKGGYQTDSNIASTPLIIGKVVGVFLAFLGLTFVILMIFAGYRWMTASGNDEAVKKAKATIKQSLIGLIVAISGYTIWNFVFERLIQ